jgi:protein phosphatase 1 regulatory subunit 7
MISPEVEGEEGFRLMGPSAFPRSIFIESHRIDACMAYALRNHSGRIAISPLGGGFKLPDLSFLARFPWVEHVTIMYSEMIDVSAVSTLGRLRFLQISGTTKQPLDLANFPLLRELRVQWWPKLRFGDALASLRVLSLSHYAPESGDLITLPKIPHLEDLNLVQARNLTLSGIDRFPHLKRLTIAYFPKLVDLSPLTAFADGLLEILEFGNCPKLARHDQVRVIQSLRRLAFNRCGEIPSLSFLDDLQAVESFSFVGTNIVDGDLRPCLRLRFAGFLDKRHYSHRSSDFPEASTPTKLTPRQA